MKLPNEACEVEDEDMMEEDQPSSPELPEKLSKSRMEELKRDFLNGTMKLKQHDDVSVRVWLGKSTIFMHKDLFAVSSTVFRELLKNSLSTGGGTTCSVCLQGEPEVFKLVKHFLYCNLFGQVVKIDVAFKLLEFSLRYNIPRLIPRTVEIILAKMEPEHSFQALEIARVWEITELEKRVFKMIAKNAESVLESKKFKELGSYDVIRILSLDDLPCTEEQVFDAAVRWAQHGHRNKTQKYYFSQVEKSIRFPLMTPSQLAAVTAKADLLDPKDLVKLFQYACLPASSKGSIKIKYNTNARANNAVSPAAAIISDIASQPKPSSSTKMKTPEETVITPLSSGEPEAKRRRISTPAEIDNSGETSIISNLIETPTTTDSAETSPRPTDRKLPESTGAEDPESDGEDLFTVVKCIAGKESQSFEAFCRRHIKVKAGDEKRVSGLRIDNVKLQQNYGVKELKKCNSLEVDTTCNFFKTVNDEDEPTFFRNFVAHFDPMRFITVTRDLTKMPSPENVWSLGMDILLKFNGVTFLKVQHANENQKDALVLNYISDSLEVLKNEELQLSTLAISNCEFSMSTLKERGRGRKLEKLVLYRVWGEFTLDEIMKECPIVTELRLWKHMPVNCWFKEAKSFIEPLSLNFAANSFAARNTLKKLSLHKTQLKFPSRCINVVPCLEELWLEECYILNRGKIDEVFHDTFPSLKRLVLRERVKTDKKGYLDMATSRLLNCVLTKIETIELIRVVGMTWKIKKMQQNGTFIIEAGTGAEDKEDVKMSNFLKEAGLAGCPDSFVIEKVAGGWKGSNLDSDLLDDQEDNMEYNWYDLVNFFDSCECFEDYFLQDNDFPRPQLRY